MSLRIADHWFERKRIDDEITLLFEPHVDAFIRCNIWHVKGRDRDAMIDTGLGIRSLREAAADLLEKPIVAVATHIHYDHVGSLHEFDTRVMHRIEAPAMQDYREFATLVGAELLDDFSADLAEWSNSGDPGESDDWGNDIPELLVAAVPRGFDPAAYSVVSTNPNWIVDEGDVIDLGDRHFEVLHLPGHSAGSIGLWEEVSGTLFSGDAVYDGPLIDQLPESDITAYIQTMKRLRELPVRVVHAGHEPSFGRERLHEIIDAYLKKRDN
jgi:glyoxylase-like metal-dependent hydrolase (beta-lactamase superfamily II)